jgi:transposase InsO family protein
VGATVRPRTSFSSTSRLHDPVARPAGPPCREDSQTCLQHLLPYGRQNLHITTCRSLGLLLSLHTFSLGPQSALHWTENRGGMPILLIALPVLFVLGDWGDTSLAWVVSAGYLTGSAKRKLPVVVDPLRGADTETLSRQHRATASAALIPRHDNGRQNSSQDFRNKVRLLRMRSSPGLIRWPEGNGCIERFFRTLKDGCAAARPWTSFNRCCWGSGHPPIAAGSSHVPATRPRGRLGRTSLPGRSPHVYIQLTFKSSVGATSTLPGECV